MRGELSIHFPVAFEGQLASRRRQDEEARRNLLAGDLAATYSQRVNVPLSFVSKTERNLLDEIAHLFEKPTTDDSCDDEPPV